jgi:hypothetical protein
MKNIISRIVISTVLLTGWLSPAAAQTRGHEGHHHAQDTIIYHNGPTVPFDFLSVDLDQDGTADVRFETFSFCTTDIPISGCTTTFQVTALGTNAILSQAFHRATMVPFGAWIGSMAPDDSAWTEPGGTVLAATYSWSQRYQTSDFSGPLADAGVGYLGVQFAAADGLHYGWIRLCASPVSVIDWAYEARPHRPIRAGFIGSNGESLQFCVNFRGRGGDPREATGSFILTGNILRGELRIAGLAASADIGGPAPAHAKAKPFASFGQPIVARTNLTSFFADIVLTRPQVQHLLRGADHVSIDGGAIAGDISLQR